MSCWKQHNFVIIVDINTKKKAAKITNLVLLWSIFSLQYCVVKVVSPFWLLLFSLCDFYRDAMHSADNAVASCLSVCLSVCLSDTATHAKRLNTIIKLFSPLGSSTILVLPLQTVWHSDVLMGVSKCKKVWTKIAVFDQYISLSPKWYKIAP